MSGITFLCQLFYDILQTLPYCHFLCVCSNQWHTQCCLVQALAFWFVAERYRCLCHVTLPCQRHAARKLQQQPILFRRCSSINFMNMYRKASKDMHCTVFLSISETFIWYTLCLKKTAPLRQVGITSVIFQIQKAEIYVL